MRQIKFRAWDKEKKMMINWRGEYHGKGGGGGNGHIYDGDEKLNDAFYHLPILFQNIQNKDIKLMQYIGLKDMDGTEVYEGDIIDFGGLKPIEIVWRDAGFKSKLIPYEHSEPIILTQEGFTSFAKVIGNIYENPELLK